MESRRVGSFEVASQVAEVTFLPVILGLILQKLTPNFAERLKRPVRVLANLCFAILFTLVITLIIFSPNFRTLLQIGMLPVFAIVLIVGSSLGLGHFLGGPARKQRTTLAVACIARNVGLAIFIAQLCDEGGTYIPTILTYMILGVILAFPYSKWSKQSTQT
jgi:BASS family bile acid:Na+ symporter